MKPAVSQEVRAYIDGLDNEQRKAESESLLEIFARATGLQAELWSGSMIGYGSYHYRYESGREGDWFLTGLRHARGLCRSTSCPASSPIGLAEANGQAPPTCFGRLDKFSDG